ncbi:hypothetical protein GCM10027028_65360 [Streptomyces sundarbansensis]
MDMGMATVIIDVCEDDQGPGGRRAGIPDGSLITHPAFDPATDVGLSRSSPQLPSHNQPAPPAPAR